MYLAGLQATDPETGASAVQVACEAQSLASLNMLLQANASLNVKDSKGRTSLHVCAEMGWQEGLDLLLEAKADPNQEARLACPVLPLSILMHLDCS